MTMAWEHRCRCCGKTFHSSRHDARMCGATCRRRAHRRRSGINCHLTQRLFAQEFIARPKWVRIPQTDE